MLLDATATQWAVLVWQTIVAWCTGWTRQGVSDAAGSASFVVWLFAQSPQLYENYARASCDGLSPIFLAQWMAGDITNLAGCLLTHQLPFQVAVAGYFCIVDSCICLQYYYYTHVKGASVLRGQRSRYASSVSQLTAQDIHSVMSSPRSTRNAIPASWVRSSVDLERTSSSSSVASSANAASVKRGVIRSASQSPSSAHALRRSDSWRVLGGDRATDSARAFATVTASGHSVAEYAALRRAAVEQHARELARLGGTSATAASRRARRATGSGARRRPPHWEPAELSPTRERSGSAERQPRKVVEGQDAPPTMSDSFLTEASGSSSRYAEEDAGGYGTASVSTLPGGLDGSVITEGSEDQVQTHARGRDMSRTAQRIEAAVLGDASPGGSGFTARGPAASTHYFDAEHESHAPQLSPESSRPASPQQEMPARRGAAAKRKAGAALVGIGTLLGLGGSGAGTALFRSPGTMEIGWADVRHPVMLHEVPLAAEQVWSLQQGESQRTYVNVQLPSAPMHHENSEPEPSPRPRRPRHSPPMDESDPNWDRILGRISAWACCVLYMTSRLPQILSNHVRRSVEGLSILLFMAAATGNALYSLSILASPKAVGPGAGAFLGESLPFLLGSGGTLVFDGVIVGQWLVWRKQPVIPLAEEDEEDALEEELVHPLHAPPPGAFVARPGFSRRSSIISALEDVERRTRSQSRPRSAADSLRRSTSTFSRSRTRTSSNLFESVRRQRVSSSQGERPQSVAGGEAGVRWPRLGSAAASRERLLDSHEDQT